MSDSDTLLRIVFVFVVLAGFASGWFSFETAVVLLLVTIALSNEAIAEDSG